MIHADTSLCDLYVISRFHGLAAEDIWDFAFLKLDESVDEDLLSIVSCGKDDSECVNSVTNVLFLKEKNNFTDDLNVLRHYVSYTCRQVLSGQIDVLMGVDLIASATNLLDIPHTHEFDTFKYASSEMQDRPDALEIFMDGITEEVIIWANR